jgi:hypothetical protein
MVAVSSSMIKDVSYTPETSELFVTFANNSRWKYTDVPEETYDGMLHASSAGKFFHDQVKNSFDGAPV